jgi:uncharacterized protein (DUF305 family)
MKPSKQVAAVVAVVALVSAGIAAVGAIAARGPAQQPPMGGMGMGGMGMGGMGMGGMHVTSERDYLAEMIPHHQEAIDAAKVLRDKSGRAVMRGFAKDIIATQEAENAQMRTWLQTWYAGVPSVPYEPMMRDLTKLSGDALDRAFLEDMIPHHHMAVMMSQQLINHGLVEHADVTPFARKIRDTQRAEIRTMQSWRRDWFGEGGGGMGMRMGMR